MARSGEGIDRGWYEYIVVGCGGIGSGAVYWLARRAGPGVLGLEQFNLGHDHGGSQDHSRIIRPSHSDTLYTKLCAGGYRCWEEVEKDSGLQLVYKTGGVHFGRRGSIGEKMVDQFAESMDVNGIKYENLDGLRLRQRFPQFNVDENYRAVFQKDIGLVDAALANAVHIQLARKYGATILEETKVEKIARTNEGSLQVFTNRGTFRCRRVVIAAGAWANAVLSSVGVELPLRVTQEQVVYFATPNIKEFTKDSFPVWLYHGEENEVYGLPIHGNSGAKIAVDNSGEHVTAETRTYIPNQKRLQQCIDFLKEHIPGYLGPVLRVKTCLYTMPPDRHYVLDTCHRTNYPDVSVFLGAGHGFKIASGLGRVLSELAIDGRTDYDISAFSLGRKALTDPDFKPLRRIFVTDKDYAKL